MKLKKKQVNKLSEIEDGYIVRVNDNHIFLSKEAKLVWDLCENSDTVRDIQEKLSGSYSDASESKIIELLKILKSYGLIEIQDKRSDFSEPIKEDAGFLPLKKIQLVGRKRTAKIIRALKPLLGFLIQERWIAASYIISWFTFFAYLVYTRSNPFLDIAYMNYALVIFLAPILVLHELAHAVVSEKLGAEVNGFGLGVYKIVPFFYTDTSETLLLKRKDRIKVSLAGPAVNFIFVLIFIIMAILFGRKDFFALSSLLFFFGLSALVPVFESDGYYALIDYGRVNNPEKETLSYIRSFLRKDIQNLERRQKVVLTIYCISYIYSVFLIVYFFLFFFPVYIQREIYYSLNMLSLDLFELGSFIFGLLYLALLFSIGASFVIDRLKRLTSNLSGK